ncbi:MAG TPA: YraN family protein [Ktedonobacterales bacterium]|nr:YraN family protein [Ktedonobacterales bacterium]
MKTVKPEQPTKPAKTPNPTPRATLGAAGERLAASWLEDHGYRILARNWRCPYGELDLIAEQDGALIAVEVKTRRGTVMGAPEEAVTPTKQRRLIASMQTYVQEWLEARRAELGRYPPEPAWRIDVVAVQLAPTGKLLAVRHHPSAVTLVG